MGSVADAIKQLRQESKYIHILSRAHKTLDESGEVFFNLILFLYLKTFIVKHSLLFFFNSTMVSKKNTGLRSVC